METYILFQFPSLQTHITHYQIYNLHLQTLTINIYKIRIDLVISFHNFAATIKKIDLISHGRTKRTNNINRK